MTRAFPEGTVAVVTGAGRGLGRAIARDLADAGATVVVNWSRSEAQAADLVEEIRAAGGCAVPVRADVSNENDVRSLFRFVKTEWGRADVLVNNAGIVRDGHVLTMGTRNWQDVINTNLTGTFLCCREGMKLMSYRKTGSIVNLSSVVATLGNPGQANYAASKGGIESLTRVLAREGARSGIRVNSVAPGLITSDMSRAIPSDIASEALAAIPLGRYGEPNEVSKLVVFLASEDASYITGQIVTVDGGLS
jgi:3-oxoacyl-[acyl-carrier protein] reductase